MGFWTLAGQLVMKTSSLAIGGTAVQTVTSGDPTEGNALGMGVEGCSCWLLRGRISTDSKDSGI